jgi:hypothetical protein
MTHRDEERQIHREMKRAWGTYREGIAFLVAQDEYLYERLELAFREGYMQGYASRRAAYTNGAYSKGYTEGFTEGLTFTPDAEAES